ncbi:hypothetical protein YPPY47_4706, partial [Yersinia pestis PY-47]|jgi:putative transposase
MSSA